MKILISWSGMYSRGVATALRQWLPCIFQSVSPWLSSSDIKPGHRWMHELSSTLDATDFGILCLTKDNLQSPWILFEAGALSRAVDSARVVPYLIDITPNDLQGPLSQFQAVIADRAGTLAMVEAISTVSPNNFRNTETLMTVFDAWWPKLDGELQTVKAEVPPEGNTPFVRVLTSRDLEMLELLAQGLTRWQIADALQSSLASVVRRISRLVEILNAKSVQHAVEIAKKLDLIST